MKHPIDGEHTQWDMTPQLAGHQLHCTKTRRHTYIYIYIYVHNLRQYFPQYQSLIPRQSTSKNRAASDLIERLRSPLTERPLGLPVQNHNQHLPAESGGCMHCACCLNPLTSGSLSLESNQATCAQTKEHGTQGTCTCDVF